MTDDSKSRSGKQKKIVLILAALIVVLAVLIVPPYISISRYKNSITRLISNSLGRPVKLSSVELRLLPWPGFVLTDLTVAEDPAYGAEPILHANTVKASIRLWTLWRGRMEISRISVDEASLNLVHAGPGRWNLNSILRTATARANSGSGSATEAPPRAATRLPYLEATNSRLNIKDGAEKLPFSLLNTDLSFWQEDSGEWRIRLRGEPDRTDLSLQMGDTGTVRLEASMGRAPALQQMPIHVDLDWREAQMGQLARLITGSDPGWRGDLTGQVQVDGTPDAAQVKTRLRASGVHRAEFAPAEALDFDANCAFVYHFSLRSVEKLVCDSPLGKGLVHLTGEVADAGAPPQLSLELDRVPVAAGLGILRTVRNGLAPDLEAQGTVSGKLVYAQPGSTPGALSEPQSRGALTRPQNTGAPSFRRPSGERVGAQPSSHKGKPLPPSPLSGSLTIDGFGLSGAGLSQPLRMPRIILAPAPPLAGAASQALAGTVAVAAGGAAPLTITMRLALDGYQATVRGQATLKWVRDLAHLTSLTQANALNNLAGDPTTMDLTAQGRWQPGESVAADALPADKLTGILVVHNANWKADFLANHIRISQATLHFGDGQLSWDPVDFSYGAVEGTASVSFPATCAHQPCPVQFQLQFGDLDVSSIEAAFLGAQEPNTLLSTVIARLDPAPSPSWPELIGTVKADSLVMDTVTLVNPAATLAIHSDHAEFTALDAGLLGGQVHASGSMQWAGTNQAKPAYSIDAHFHELSPQAVGRVLGESWMGGGLDADGKLNLTGFSGADLTSSAKGNLHFDWKHGAIFMVPAAPETVKTAEERTAKERTADEKPSAHAATKADVPPELARFDDWTADADIANGTITLGTNKLVSGSHKRAVEGTLTLGDPPTVQFALPRNAVASKR